MMEQTEYLVAWKFQVISSVPATNGNLVQADGSREEATGEDANSSHTLPFKVLGY